VEKGEKLGQLQFSLFISALQNLIFAWCSCSNRREKHRTTFANAVEGCLIYNFRIYRFCRTVQIFGEMHGQSRVDRLEISGPRSRAGPRAPPLAVHRCTRAPGRARDRRSVRRAPRRGGEPKDLQRVAPALTIRAHAFVHWSIAFSLRARTPRLCRRTLGINVGSSLRCEVSVRPCRLLK
jgi:hypothetical protein